MKIHHCPVEGASVTFEHTCNWCGQREFIGLTDAQLHELFNVQADSIDARIYMTAYKLIERKLREVNT